jgi:PAS domain S-box-containing protein
MNEDMDRSERRPSGEEELMGSLPLLIECVTDYAIFLLDPQGIVRTWSPGAEKMKGWRAEEIVGRPFTLFYSPDDVATGKPRILLMKAAQAGRVSDEGWRLRKDGSRFWASVVLTALYHETGAVKGYAKITRDMSERKRMEDELSETLRCLEEANRRLEESDRIKSVCLSMASHELRSPLTSIKGHVDNLLEGVAGVLPEKVVRYLDRINRNVDRVIRLTTMILDLSRIEAGEMRVDLEPLQLGSMIAEVCRDFEPTARSKDIAITVTPLADVAVRADRDKVEQVLHNLLHNAVKFTPSRGDIVVESGTADEDEVVITVADTGCGIPGDHREKIFEKFYRAPSHVQEGAGLGLAITKSLVEMQGGRIWVESEPGRGSRFSFTLRRA